MNYVKLLNFNIFMKIIYRYILVFIDRLFKMRHFVLISTMKVEKVANSFYQNIWKLHDLLDALISNRDTQFIFDFWKLMCRRLKIDVKLFIEYHSKIDDQIEKVNVIMKLYLWAYVNYMQDDWTQWLSNAKFASNNIDFFSVLAFSFLVNFEQHSRVRFESKEFLS
jgi:hypothetical protein